MIEDILSKQKQFFESGRTLDVNFRLRYLKKLKAAIKLNESELSAALYTDLGKNRSEAYMTEIGMVLEDLSFIIKRLKKWVKPKKVSAPLAQFPSKCFTLPTPYGNTLIFSPWNYPFLLTVQPLIGAICAGNTAIVKPSKFSAATSAAIKKLLSETFPEEYVYTVYDDGIDGKSLTEYKFDYVFFTGSERVGKEIYLSAAKFLTPVTLELGGKSPAIVDKTAKLELAAKRIAFGKFLNAGQTCVAPDYVLVNESVAEKFVSELKKQIATLFPSALENNEYGKIITKKHFDRVKGLICNEKTVYGGKYDEGKLKIEPTVIYPATVDDGCMKEEIFGPVLPVIKYETYADMLEIIAKFRTPLALYLFTKNRENERKILNEISFGGGCVNDTVMHIASSRLPFGGVGGSGIGSYHGKKSFETFSHYKSILKKSNLIDLPVRYSPYSKRKDKIIKFFMK